MSALDVTEVSFAYLRNIQRTHAYANSIVVSVLSALEEILATRYMKWSGATGMCRLLGLLIIYHEIRIKLYTSNYIRKLPIFIDI